MSATRVRSGAGSGTARRRAQPQPGGAQPAHQLATFHLLCAGRHHLGAVLFWHVVVIALERAARDTQSSGELVQFVEGVVTDEVTPPPSTPPPPGFVDEHGHGRSLADDPRPRAPPGAVAARG